MTLKPPQENFSDSTRCLEQSPEQHHQHRPLHVKALEPVMTGSFPAYNLQILHTLAPGDQDGKENSSEESRTKKIHLFQQFTATIKEHLTFLGLTCNNSVLAGKSYI